MFTNISEKKIGDKEFEIKGAYYGIYKLIYTNEETWVYERTSEGRLVCYEIFKGKLGDNIPSSTDWGKIAFTVMNKKHIKKYVPNFY